MFEAPERFGRSLYQLRGADVQFNMWHRGRNGSREAMRIVNSREFALALLLFVAISLCRSAEAAPKSAAGLEFPLIMRQNVVAGTTPVGTKVQAKLTLATLVNGVVIPEDAIFSGEVTESVQKSDSQPSRLAVRMDSAQWKSGSAPMKIFLTAWYYPSASLIPGESAADRYSHDHGLRRPGGFPDPNGDDANSGQDAASLGVSEHRVQMKDIEATRNKDGMVTLTSKHVNIKLDKQTTYVFATSDLAGGTG